jgi:hypothetical protein
MKTTIDLPEELLHRAENTVAAKRNTTIEEFVVESLGFEYTTRNNACNVEVERMDRASVD